MSALLLVGDLVFDLDGAGARLDHASSKQISGFFVAESGIDVSDDWHHVGLEPIDLLGDALQFDFVTALARLVEVAEQAAQLTGIGLP